MDARRWQYPVLAAIVMTLTALVSAQSKGPEPALTLTDVAVAGLHRYAPADVARLSGLHTGSVVTVSGVQAAAVQLAHTGLFKAVRYRFATTATTASVTFTVEEAPVSTPVVFDNFLTLSDSDLRSAIAEDVPGFDGIAPDTGEFPDYLRGVLQKILTARHLSGRVEFTSQVNLKTQRKVDLFAIRDSGVDLRVCRVDLPGADTVHASDVLASGDPVVGQPYSRFFTTSLAEGTWLQFYRDHGHWKATLGEPSAAPVSGTDCGVAVTVPVHEGPVFTWDHAEWPGASMLSPAALDKLLDMKTGAVAVASKIAKGFDRVQHEYVTHGYLFAHLNPVPQLNDATLGMTIRVAVSEGAQYHMGTLAITGIDSGVAATLQKKWKLQPGAIYDATYLSRFMGDEVEHRRGLGIVPESFGPHVVPDETTHVVNVTFSPE
jgi:outer membrane protein insertion porin family